MGDGKWKGGGCSLLKILIQSTPVTEARKRSPADAGSSLIKEFLMAAARLPIVPCRSLRETTTTTGVA